jgi:hypothetical protein
MVIEAEPSDHQRFAEAKKITDPLVVFVNGLDITVMLGEDMSRMAATLERLFKAAAEDCAGDRETDGVGVG